LLFFLKLTNAPFMSAPAGYRSRHHRNKIDDPDKQRRLVAQPED